MAYRINVDLMGDYTSEDEAQDMVRQLQDLGYDVEYTESGGLVNRIEIENPVPDDVWDTVLDSVWTDSAKRCEREWHIRKTATGK